MEKPGKTPKRIKITSRKSKSSGKNTVFGDKALNNKLTLYSKEWTAVRNRVPRRCKGLNAVSLSSEVQYAEKLGV